MYVLTLFGTDLRPRRRQIALVLLGVLLCSPTTVVGAGSNQDEDTAERVERFTFTGTYRFKLTKKAVPRTPEAPSLAVVTPSRSSKPAAVTAGAAPATVYIVPRKIKNAGASRSPIDTALQARPSSQMNAPAKTALSTRATQTSRRLATPAVRNVRSDTRPKAPLSRDTRSSLGATPDDTSKAIARQHGPDQVASAVPSRQRTGPSPAALNAKAAQASLPVVHVAVSRPASSAISGERQAVTVAPAGRVINVPPLPAMYRRPDGAPRTRNDGPASRSKRIAKRAVKPQRTKSVQSKPASIFSAQPAWANGALFKSD